MKRPLINTNPVVRAAKARALILCSLFTLPVAFGQVNVLSQRAGNNRTGASLSETQLTSANVNTAQFGKLFSYPVDDSVQAQALYVSNLAIAGKGAHNVVFIATMNDSVYAFDADSNYGANATPLWHVNFTNPQAGITSVPIVDILGAGNGDKNIVGNVGIESTPVIDPSTNTMYLVARTLENGTFVQRLHALDITSGAEKFGGPTLIQASVSGNGSANNGGVIAFDPEIHNQRTGLALANGKVVIAWASHEDMFSYHGWVMSYNAQTLTQTSVFCVTPNGSQGGIWTSGWAPAVDASGNVYTITGNGDWDGITNFGESFIKFSTSAAPTLVDWFTPDTWAALNSADLDLGSSGAMLVPGTSLIVGGGKSGILYLLQDGSLGHELSGNMQAVQSLNVMGGLIFGGPVYWNRSTAAGGPLLYIWTNNDYLKSFHFNGSTFDSTPVARSTVQAVQGFSGGVLWFSSNGDTAGSGIVWSSMALSDSAGWGVHQGVLRALDAATLTELWNSNQNPTRDNPGDWPKYSAPVVANGKVYLASFSNQVSVYGLLTSDFSVAATPATEVVYPGGSTSFTVNLGQVGNLPATVTLSATGLPSGVTASFNPRTVTGTGTSTLTLKAAAGVMAGTYSFSIAGKAGTVSHSASATIAVSAATAGHGAISVDFVGGGTAMSPSEVAGVVPRADWNEAVGAASSSALPLLDETGTATGATASWNASNVWSLGIGNQAGDFDMMNGYLDTPLGTSTTVSIAGLPLATYDVYVYADGDNATSTKTATYSISGAGFTKQSVGLTDSPNTNFGGTYTQANNGAGNFVKFTVTAKSFTITAVPGAASDGNPRAPINGIQIVTSSNQSTPPPSTNPALVWQDPSTGASQLWTLSATQPFSVTSVNPISAANPWRIVAVADFNQDGYPDVLWQDPVSGAAQIWYLGGTQGNTTIGTATVSAANSWRIVAAGDFNGDGQPDLIWQDPVSGAAQIWFLGGGQTINVTGSQMVAASNAWRIVGAGDFNRDGIADLLWEDPASGTTQVWYLQTNSQSPVASVASLTGPNIWSVATVTDLNGDGQPDVVWQDPVSGSAQVWYLGGSQGLTLSGTGVVSGPTTLRIAGSSLASQ